MRPTRLRLLLAVALIAGVAGHLVARAVYGSLPMLPPYTPLWFVVLAIAEAYTAYTTRARLAGRPRTKPIHPITVARLAALAKATSLAAALTAGWYGGLLTYLVTLDARQARRDGTVAAVVVLAALLLAVAALVLERVCRVHPPPGTTDLGTGLDDEGTPPQGGVPAGD